MDKLTFTEIETILAALANLQDLDEENGFPLEAQATRDLIRKIETITSEALAQS